MPNRTTSRTTSPTSHQNQLALIPASTTYELRWWAPIWRGLVVDPTAKHRQVIGNALWVYVYLIMHADRSTGVLRRKLNTIAKEMSITPRVIQYGISKLRRGGYITTKNSGRFLEITIAKWKPLKQKNKVYA